MLTGPHLSCITAELMCSPVLCREGITKHFYPTTVKLEPCKKTVRKWLKVNYTTSVTFCVSEYADWTK